MQGSYQEVYDQKTVYMSKSKRKQRTKTSTGVCTCTRRRRKQNTNLPFIPRDIMLNILSRLPAEFLHSSVKHVSKTWANIIRDPRFIKMHLLHYSDDVGLLIRDSIKPFGVRYLEAKEGKIKISRPNYHIPGVITLASHEGILLLSPYEDHLYVANCVTKQGLMLPCHRFATCKERRIPLAGFSRVTQSGALKVIFLCEDLDGLLHWHVLTVGTDMAWRKIEYKFTRYELNTMSLRPISVNEILYWANRRVRYKKFLAIDLTDESIHWIQVPEEFHCAGRYFDEDEPSTYALLKLDNYLCCIVTGSNEMEMNVWILKDMLSSMWVKIRTFKCNVGLTVPVVWTRRGNYFPVTWLDNGRALVFCKDNGIGKKCVYVVYNLTTGKLRYISNVSVCCTYMIVEHTSTLVSL